MEQGRRKIMKLYINTIDGNGYYIEVDTSQNLKQAIDYIKIHDYLIGKIVTTGKQIAVVTNTITTIIN